jgi:GTPase SAR1 family protein
MGSILEYLYEENSDTQKILFTGLDDAGKTSIILALKREFSKIAIIKPTKGAQRRIFEFLGKDISEWDLGGQERYRISYLKNPNKYFDKTATAIYVIDIQNKARISESLSYLNDVIEQFKILEIEPPIFIFFHKYDPVLTKTAYEEINHLFLYLKERIKNALNYKNVFFYHTTIFNLSTIITAMSDILLMLYPKEKLIQKTIYEFANKFNAEGLEIIDDNSLIVGSYYKNEETKDILNASTPYFLSLDDSFHYSNNINEENEDKMIIQRFGKYFLFKRFNLKEGTPPYYLLLSKANPEFNTEELNAFINLLKEILYK